MERLPDTARVVRNARAAVRMTQAQFGRELGRPQSIVSKYERGLVEPPGHVIIQCMTLIGYDNELSAAEVARMVRDRLDSPQFAALRKVIADLINSSSSLT